MESFKNIPVYLHTEQYARRNNETEQYYASYRANIACKIAIENAITQNYSYDTSSLSSSGVKQVEERFGIERMLHVLAVTVRYKDWDDRISDDNKNWAQTIPVVFQPDGMGRDLSTAYVVDRTQSGLVNLFINQVRRSLQVKRPSILEELKTLKNKNGTSFAGEKENGR